MNKGKEWLKAQVKDGECELKSVYDNYVPYEKVLIADDVNELIDQLDEPELPVIPQFVDTWLKKRKKDFKTAYDAILYIHSCGWDDETHIEFKLYKWIPDNVELFARVWSDIYMVEEEAPNEQ